MKTPCPLRPTFTIAIGKKCEYAYELAIFNTLHLVLGGTQLHQPIFHRASFGFHITLVTLNLKISLPLRPTFMVVISKKYEFEYEH